jgi:hypothetical protein
MEQLDKEELELMNKLNEIKMKKKNFEKINKNKQIIMGLIDENKSLEELLIEEIPYECIIKSSNPYEYEEQELLFKLGEARRKMKLFNKIEENKRRIKSIEEDIEDEIIMNDIIKEEEVKPVEKPVIKGDMTNLKNAKLLGTVSSKEEMDKFKFNKLCEKVPVDNIVVGDYIEAYSGKGWSATNNIGRVSRITDKTIFYNICKETDNNKVKYYEWKPEGTWTERSYTYYFFDTDRNEFLEDKEIKILKKSYNKIYRAKDNFLIMDEMDYGA